MITVTVANPTRPPWWKFWAKPGTETVTVAHVNATAAELRCALFSNAPLADGRRGIVLDLYDGTRLISQVAIPAELIRVGTTVTATNHHEGEPHAQ